MEKEKSNSKNNHLVKIMKMDNDKWKMDKKMKKNDKWINEEYR